MRAPPAAHDGAPGAGNAGTFTWGAGESFVGRSSPAPPPSPCIKMGGESHIS